MSLPADLSSSQSLSAVFFNMQLKKFACIWSPKPQKNHQPWLFIDSKKEVESTMAANERQENIVLVGQGINFASLHTILSQSFTGISRAVISQHQLSSKFPQQAICVKLIHQHAQTIATKACLQHLSKNYFIDCFAVSSVCLNKPGLIVMDMDSTIINMECIDEIAGLVGAGEKVSALTERAMQGELDFNQSLKARVACLKGVSLAQLDALKVRLPINPGFAKTMQILQENGWYTCIASGGFTYFADYLAATFELSMAKSNQLGVENSKLNGLVAGDIINGEMKRDILLAQAKAWQIPMQQTLAIGDGANDLLMMNAAALGLAYKAKPKVKVAADANISYCGFEGLLYCLQ